MNTSKNRLQSWYGLTVSFTYSKYCEVKITEVRRKSFSEAAPESLVLWIFKIDFSLHVMQSLASDHERWY